MVDPSLNEVFGEHSLAGPILVPGASSEQIDRGSRPTPTREFCEVA
jgi:hypothetical protein